MELYIIRHGRTVWNKAGLIQGTSDVELLPEGIEMAQQTGEGLKDVKFDAIYSSPLKRAYDTAVMIKGDRDMDIISDVRLTEMGFGVCEGMKYVSREDGGGLLEGFWDSPETYEAPEGGDSFYQVCERAAGFLKFIEEKHEEGERIMIVAHAAMNQAMFSYLENLEVKDFWKHGKQLNCAVTVAEHRNGQWHITDRNKIYYEV